MEENAVADVGVFVDIKLSKLPFPDRQCMVVRDFYDRTPLHTSLIELLHQCL
jgi:hypothetical protein